MTIACLSPPSNKIQARLLLTIIINICRLIPVKEGRGVKSGKSQDALQQIGPDFATSSANFCFWTCPAAQANSIVLRVLYIGGNSLKTSLNYILSNFRGCRLALHTNYMVKWLPAVAFMVYITTVTKHNFSIKNYFNSLM